MRVNGTISSSHVDGEGSIPTASLRGSRIAMVLDLEHTRTQKDEMTGGLNSMSIGGGQPWGVEAIRLWALH